MSEQFGLALDPADGRTGQPLSAATGRDIKGRGQTGGSNTATTRRVAPTLEVFIRCSAFQGMDVVGRVGNTRDGMSVLHGSATPARQIKHRGNLHSARRPAGLGELRLVGQIQHQSRQTGRPPRRAMLEFAAFGWPLADHGTFADHKLRLESRRPLAKRSGIAALVAQAEQRHGFAAEVHAGQFGHGFFPAGFAVGAGARQLAFAHGGGAQQQQG